MQYLLILYLGQKFDPKRGIWELKQLIVLENMAIAIRETLLTVILYFKREQIIIFQVINTQLDSLFEFWLASVLQRHRLLKLLLHTDHAST